MIDGLYGLYGGRGRADLETSSRALETGALTSVELLRASLDRIAARDRCYRAVITPNPDAFEIARALDRERAEGRVRGTLHGIPILVKDNLDTGDRMPTTAGSLALAGTCAPRDSTVVARLRAAGAVIAGKTNLSEWANFRSPFSSSGWSSAGGQTRNAHDPQRTPGGSSSGSAVAVALGYCVAAIGTETDGSIVVPASMNGIVGIKPTVGLVSRQGIVPISHSQDTAGPMARSVRDAALVLMAIAGPDREARASLGALAPESPDGVGHAPGFDLNDLEAVRLDGVRLGVARAYTGFNPRADALFESALARMRGEGATVVDPVPLPPAEAIRPHERIVMETEFKVGLNAYLATRPPGQTVSSLAELIGFDRDHAETVMPHFGQEILESAEARGGLEGAEYRAARATSLRLAATEGIDAALAAHDLDAIVAPTTTPAWRIDWLCGDNRKGSAAGPPGVAGYPHITVPMGRAAHLPVGLSFIGAAFTDWKLAAIARAFERAALGPAA